MFKPFAFCLCVAMMVPASAVENPFAATDAWQPGKFAALVTDFNLSAHFITDNKVLFRRGAHGDGAIYLADPATGKTETLLTESALKARLIATGIKADDIHDVLPHGYDAATKTLHLAMGGKAWAYNIATAVLTEDKPQGGPPKPPTDVASPDGKQKVISRGYNLYLVDVKTGREVALTKDGSFDKRYGTNYPLFGDMAEANSDTPPMPLAVQWSEDGTRLLTYRLLRNNAYIWHEVQQTPPDDRFPRMFTTVYPTAGAKNVPQFQPIVIDVRGASKGKVQIKELNVPSLSELWPGDPPLWWEKDRVMYEWTRRGYGDVDLYTVDPASGQGHIVVREAIKPLVTVTSSSIRSAPELGGFLSISERSGWAQLYFLPAGSDAAGGKALTTGNWEVAEVVRVAKGAPILIRGNGREAGVNPYFNSLYAVSLDGAITNLTPEPLDHRTTVSEDGKWILDEMSSPTVPTRTVIRAAADGHIVLELGKADPAPLYAAGVTPPEPFEVLADDGKTMLYGMIHRPRNFDPSHKYPVIDYVYTGPTTHVVDESFERNVASSLNTLAEIGVIVVSVDGRGTSQRGQAFRLPAYQNMGEVGIDDHIHAIKAMAEKYPYMDLTRVGVYGHSAGGYDAARFILRRPEFFKAAIASSGIQDPRLDKAWWPEVTMGAADDATWEKNSNIPVAGNLKGKLMIIHGDLDDNVPIAASMRLHKALVDAGKLHEFVIIPNRTHNTYTDYYLHTVYDFFTRTLVDQSAGK
ncbi:MAG: prolyl oligopeptidase family serine peptidase [Rhizomicrobium sp.]